MELFLQETIHKIHQAKNITMLEEILTHVCGQIGIHRFSLFVIQPVNMHQQEMYSVNNWGGDADAWIDEFYIKKGLYDYDPALVHLLNDNTPYLYKDVRKINFTHDKQKEMLSVYHDVDVLEGVSISINGRHGETGMLSFNLNNSCTQQQLLENDRFTDYLIPFTQAILPYIHQKYMALLYKMPGFKIPHLTPRQKEILLWVADGKTNEEIAIILDISVPTIRSHIDLAAKKLNTYGKTQTACRAILLQLI